MYLSILTPFKPLPSPPPKYLDIGTGSPLNKISGMTHKMLLGNEIPHTALSFGMLMSINIRDWCVNCTEITIELKQVE